MTGSLREPKRAQGNKVQRAGSTQKLRKKNLRAQSLLNNLTVLYFVKGKSDFRAFD